MFQQIEQSALRENVTDFSTGQWESIEIPLATFDSNGLASRTNISQIILVGRTDDGAGNLVPGQATVFVDNFFFY